MAQRNTATSSHDNDTTRPTTLEVEQKFAISDMACVQKRLTEAGFIESSTCKKTMVDWYFDVPAANYPLLRQDCWLRYRSTNNENNHKEEEEGQWELKRGTPTVKTTKDSKATVYQEIEGTQALLEARELIQSFSQLQSQVPPNNPLDNDHDHNTQYLYHDYKIPQPPVDMPGLEPLARIGTQRSTWRSSSSDSCRLSTNVVVDLDTTDFDYAVGEVETIVTDAHQVSIAQEELQTWLRNVLGAAAVQGPPPMGKLEFYLSTQRPEILAVLVEAGLLPQRN